MRPFSAFLSQMKMILEVDQKNADISETGYERTKFREPFAQLSCKPFAHRGTTTFNYTVSNLVSLLPSQVQIWHSAKK